MPQADLAAELLALETRFWDAMRDGDAETAVALSAETCILTGAQGVSKIDRAAMRKMMGGGAWKLKSYQFSDFQVLSVTGDVAVVGYKVHEEMEVEGQALSLDAADASTWVRRDGAWVCVVHSESPLGDAFGRDRLKA